MKLSRSIATAAAGLSLLLAASGTQVTLQGQEPSQIEVWTPLPVKPNPFVPPHKPWTKLSEVLAKHKGQQNWSELIVDDNLFHAGAPVRRRPPSAPGSAPGGGRGRRGGGAGATQP